MSMSDVRTTRASHDRHSPPHHGACAHLTTARPRHGHRCKSDGQRCDMTRAIGSNAARCVSRRIQSSCTLSRTRHASRDLTMRICMPRGVQHAAARLFAARGHDLHSAASTLLPRPPLHSTSFVEFEGEAVDLVVSDCARARLVPAARCNALPDEMVLAASTALDAARPTPVPS